MKQYPSFIEPECSMWFFHWLKHFPKGCMIENCTLCLNVKENIKFATGLMLESIYQNHDRLTSGSNIVSINAGHMTRQRARDILATFDKTSHCQESLNFRLVAAMKDDFPGMQIPQLHKNSGIYTPFMGRGSNSLYYTLSCLYKAALGEHTSEIVLSRISVIEFCLLCFHLNGQYHLTSNSISQLWSGSLRLNSITTLLHEKPALVI